MYSKLHRVSSNNEIEHDYQNTTTSQQQQREIQ